MSHSLTNIWIHGVFATKNREALIAHHLKNKLHEHIVIQVKESLHCKVRIINGTDDHIHILFLLNPNVRLKDVFQKMKGESSHWWNEQNLTTEHFDWQIGYGAFSVSQSQLLRVEGYIRNQEQHHRTMTYQQEMELLTKKLTNK